MAWDSLCVKERFQGSPEGVPEDADSQVGGAQVPQPLREKAATEQPALELQKLRDDLKKLERSLEENYRLAPVAMVVLDRRGVVRDANACLCRLLRAEPRALLGTEFSRFIAHGSRLAFRHYCERLMDRDLPDRIRSVLLDRRGGRMPVLVDGVGSSGGEGCRLAFCDIPFLKYPTPELGFWGGETYGEHVETDVADPPENGTGAPELVYHRQTCRISLDGRQLVRDMPARMLRKMMGVFVSTGRKEFEHKEFIDDPEITFNPLNPSLIIRIQRLAQVLEDSASGLVLEKSGRGRIRLHIPESLRYREES